MSRADVGAYELEKLPPFYFYVDEFQNFANESFASILSEARKYNLALTVAHQYVDQMEDEVKSAVFGNVGTMVVFRVGATDAEVFEKEFAPVFTMDDIVNLSAYQVYLRLMIDGVGSQPFSARMLPPIEKPPISYEQAVIAYTRTTYAKPRFVVEEEIAKFYTPVVKDAPPKKSDQQYAQQPKAVPNNKPQESSKKEYRDHQEKEERVLKIRKITDDTPLPPKKIEPKKEEIGRDDVYHKNRSVEEVFHTPPAKQKEEPFVQKREKQKTLQTISVPKFDDKPAVSLKDALKKAMEDAQEERDTSSHDAKEDDSSQAVSVEDALPPRKKEVPEDVLRKLLEDEV
jgi:hypothetical protein